MKKTLVALVVTLAVAPCSPAPAAVVYVSRLGTGDVVKVDQAGNQTTFASDLGRPGAFALDALGNAFVVDHEVGRMLHITPSGAVSEYAPALPTGGYNDVAVADDGTVFLLVAAESGTSPHHGEIWQVSPLQLLADLSGVAPSSEDGRGMTFGPGGDLYVAMQGRAGAGGRILRVTRTGVVTPFYDPGLPAGDNMVDVRFDSQGRMLILGLRTATSPFGTVVWRVESNVLTEFVPPPVIPVYALQLAIDPGDNVFTNPWNNNSDGQVLRIDPTGVVTPVKFFGEAILDIDIGPGPCGDGALDRGEQCDDGNGDACDGCVNCSLEAGIACGDGVRNVACGEQCDDGNAIDGDGCSASCQEQAANESVSVTGTTATTGGSATPADPIETTVSSPDPGLISIDERPFSAAAPMGFQLLTQEIAISAPPGTAANPLTLVFRLDASRVPAGETESSLAILKNGVAVPACDAACGGPASPDPCVCARSLLGDGDVEITVRTSTASIWNFAVDRCALPETNCRAPVGPGKASLLLRDDADDTKDLVLWKWLNGTATPKEAFGNPLAADDYVFCLYAGGVTPSVRMRLEAPAGGTCDGAPCWTELRSGFKFKDRALAPDGQLQILLKGSETPGSPKIKVKGKGTGLRMSALPIPQGASVTAQLKSAGACWDATYGISPIVSDAAQFKDKSD